MVDGDGLVGICELEVSPPVVVDQVTRDGMLTSESGDAHSVSDKASVDQVSRRVSANGTHAGHSECESERG